MFIVHCRYIESKRRKFQVCGRLLEPPIELSFLTRCLSSHGAKSTWGKPTAAQNQQIVCLAREDP